MNTSLADAAARSKLLSYFETNELFSGVIDRHPQLKLPTVNDKLFYFDSVAAFNAISFFQHELRHIEGPDFGKLLELEPWQFYTAALIYGWKRKRFNTNGSWRSDDETVDSDLRKFREVFIFIPRKNGKSFIAAGFILKGLFADKEAGARCVAAAADREQAAGIYETARAIIEGNDLVDGNAHLEGMSTIHKRAMAVPSTGSNFKVLSADVKTKHGKNLSTVIVDEVHALPNRDLIEVLFTSVGARLQPLKIMATTAGYDRGSICFEYYQYAKDVLSGQIVDEEFFPIIFEANLEDDWKDEETWYKANPNLGVSVTLEYFQAEFKKAIERPSYENTFKRLHLNIWTTTDIRWVPFEIWMKNNAVPKLEDLKKEKCWAGIDLASKTDITAFVLIYPQERMYVVPYFWLPKANIALRKKRDRVDYDVWARQGLIDLIPGTRMDYSVVRKKVNLVASESQIQSIGFDPWNAQDLMTKLEDDGLEVVELQPSYKNLTDATKELEATLLAEALGHGDNAVLSWMFNNLAIQENADGCIRPSKNKSKEKIDGIVALVNAIAVWLLRKDVKQSIYKTRGVRVITA